MVEGYTSTLKKLRGTGAAVALIEDVPHPNKNIPECVSRSLDHLERCATPRSKALDYPKVNTRVQAVNVDAKARSNRRLYLPQNFEFVGAVT
jgi:hypothetical protein